VCVHASKLCVCIHPYHVSHMMCVFVCVCMNAWAQDALIAWSWFASSLLYLHCQHRRGTVNWATQQDRWLEPPTQTHSRMARLEPPTQTHSTTHCTKAAVPRVALRAGPHGPTLYQRACTVSQHISVLAMFAWAHDISVPLAFCHE